MSWSDPSLTGPLVERMKITHAQAEFERHNSGLDPLQRGRMPSQANCNDSWLPVELRR